MSKSVTEVDPQAIAEAEQRGFDAAKLAGATINPPVHTNGGQPPPPVRPWFNPVTPQEQAKAAAVPKQPPRPSLPPLMSPQRKPKVGDRVLYWLANPGAEGGAVLVPADVYGPGQPAEENGKTFDTVNLNVHEPGFLSWASSCPYSTKPRVGCWCHQSDAK